MVDDGSTDRCGEICEWYAKKDHRIKVIHKENGGLSDARNTGIQYATGEYICFIDSDDCVDKKFIEYLYHLCKTYGADIAQCAYTRFFHDITAIKPEEPVEEVIHNKEMVERLYGDEYINTVVVWNKLYKKRLFNNIQFPKGKIHEDEFTTYQLFWAANNKIVISNAILYYYRQNPNSIMYKTFDKKRLDYIIALEERMAFFKEKDKQLYQKSLDLYAYILITYYGLIKKHMKHASLEQKKLLEKFKRNYPDFMKLPIAKTTKLKYKLFRRFPNLLNFLLKIKNHIRRSM